MANIYEEKAENLHLLLDRARSDDGVTVVIPELQRPYVWTPNQVALLVDSLIRGWPFGTLLMWRVKHEELDGIPHRPFWRTIDRTENEEGTTAMRRNPPATYHMVLDGQQRLQSLLLALGGDDWGFRLEDRDWVNELQDRRPRGRQPKHRHWSKASLCFDLKGFLKRYQETHELLSIDFREVLIWGITDPTEGQSKWTKPDNYVEPLVKAYAAPHSDSLVRLSRLWQEVQPNPNLKEKEFRQIGKSFLEDHGLPEDTIAQLLGPLGEFMSTLRDVKLSKVTYLELLPFDSMLWTRDSYNDAIVNIFTRLNTAGRTLTREEITFAWLKSNWNSSHAANKSAVECFEELRDGLRQRGVDIGMDDVVNAVSFLWSVRFNDGRLLANSDLLKGSVIRPMAVDLSTGWSVIRDGMLEVMEVIEERGFTFGSGGQYASINALAVIWAWHSLTGHWRTSSTLTTLQIDSLEKKRRLALATFLDRWLLCSTWAGRWAGSSNTAVATYARELNEDWGKIRGLADYDSVHPVLLSRLESLVQDLETEAVNYVNSVAAGSRERVSVYRNLLWVWHRLDPDRWSMSKIPLRSGKSKKTALEVDHTLAFAYWERRVCQQVPTECSNEEEALALANSLGNCALLEKTFNISKSDKSLKSFLEQVHEFKDRSADLSKWAESLSIPDALLEPNDATGSEIVAALKTREGLIRSDVSEFVRGTKKRYDV
jgi:hypothetical protein